MRSIINFFYMNIHYFFRRGGLGVWVGRCDINFAEVRSILYNSKQACITELYPFAQVHANIDIYLVINGTNPS